MNDSVHYYKVLRVIDDRLFSLSGEYPVINQEYFHYTWNYPKNKFGMFVYTDLPYAMDMQLLWKGLNNVKTVIYRVTGAQSKEYPKFILSSSALERSNCEDYLNKIPIVSNKSGLKEYVELLSQLWLLEKLGD